MTQLTRMAVVATVALVVGTLAAPATGQQTAISYQGVLKDGGIPISATDARLSFRLFSAETGGSQIGSDYVAYPVVVEDGVFSTQLDFGLTPFEDGDVRWLEIGVDAAGGTSYTWLMPRTLLTAVPSALYAAYSGDGVWSLTGSFATIMHKRVGIWTESPTSPLHVEINGDSPEYDYPAITAEVTECESDEGYGIRATTTCRMGAAVTGIALSDVMYSEANGVWGNTASSGGAGVYGSSSNAYGTGIYGSINSATGRAVVGQNHATTGDAIAVRGSTSSPTGFGGYFQGRGYFQGPLGVGTTSPSAELDVVGSIRTDGLALSTSPADGFVLTSDASGNASWQAPAAATSLWDEGALNRIYYNGGNVGIGTDSPMYVLDVVGTSHFTLLQTTQLTGGHVWPQTFRLGSSATDGYVLTADSDGTGTWQPPAETFSLPYSETASSTGAAFSVANSSFGGGAHAIQGMITSPSTTAAAGEFYAVGTDGFGVKAYSDGDDAVYARQTGSTAYALHASTNSAPAAALFTNTLADATAAEFLFTGPSGSGIDVSTTGGTATSIKADADGISATGAYITTSGNNATGLVIESTGAESYGARIESPWVGLIAKGGIAGARIYGDLDLYEHGTNNKVLELGKGLDYAEGFDVTGGKGGATPGCVLVIDPSKPGQLTLSRRAYDKRVAGIVAGANSLGSGVRLGGDGFDHDVALAGRVYCNVIASDGPIEPGDLLTTSDVPGYAMKADDHGRATGAILGKAMEPLATGERGQILVLVTLQ